MKAFFREKMESARDYYAKDLQAMSPEQLAKKPGGVARSAYDYTYEVVLINRRIQARLKGEDPGAFPGGDGFLEAPADWQDKNRIVMEYEDSMNGILAVWEALTDVQIERLANEHAPMKLAFFTCIHSMYHDAQLNYVQALAGDNEVHW